jgi:soluble lytic murein transglycosylase-like protein
VTPYIGKRFGVIDSEADFAGLFVPEKNLEAAAAFLAYLLNRNGRDAAIQMYNLGEPKYWAGARVPAYLNGVLGYLDKFEG